MLKKKIRGILSILLCIVLLEPKAVIMAEEKLSGSDIHILEVKNPVYDGAEILPEEVLNLQVTDTEGNEVAEPKLTYSFYRYNDSRPNAPDENVDKLHWEHTPCESGDYWVKVKYAGNETLYPSSSEYIRFQIQKAAPVLELTTNMTEETRIGDTITVTLKFIGAAQEEEGFQPYGSAVFRAGGRFVGESVGFQGNVAQVEYVLTEQMVSISGEYVPSMDSKVQENYLTAKAELEGILGKKKEQEELKFSEIKARYGDEPKQVVISGGSGSGLLEYASSKETVATIDRNGKLVILKPGTTTLTVIRREDQTYLEQIAEYELTVEKGEQLQNPKKPVLLETTDSSISVEPVAGQEYSIDNGSTWNTTGKFKDLQGNYQYTILTRIRENALYQAGSKTKHLEVVTETKKEEAPPDPEETGEQNGGAGNVAGSEPVVKQAGTRVREEEALTVRETYATNRDAAKADRQVKADKQQEEEKQEISEEPVAEEETGNTILATGKQGKETRSRKAAAAGVVAVLVIAGGVLAGWYKKKYSKGEKDEF